MGFIFGLMLATLNLILLGCLFFYFLRNVNAFRKEKKDTDDRVKKEIRVNYLVHRFEKGHERWQFCVRGDTNATTQARSAALCRLSACDSSTAHRSHKVGTCVCLSLMQRRFGCALPSCFSLHSSSTSFITITQGKNM